MDAIAQSALPSRIEAEEPAIVAGDAQHVERKREEAVEHLFGMLALDELPDLAAESAEHVEHFLIGLPDFAAEELHDGHDFAGHGYGKPKRRSQALFRRDR